MQVAAMGAGEGKRWHDQSLLGKACPGSCPGCWPPPRPGRPGCLQAHQVTVLDALATWLEQVRHEGRQ